MARAKCYIGTSGWSYSHWAQGRFYPRGLKPSEWLAFLARHFDTVELNSSFYRLPAAQTVSRWRQVTPARFRFAIKLWRLITHRKRLQDCADALRSFFAVVGAFGPKRGPLLVQLPPSLKKDLALLEAFLADLKHASGQSRWKVAVEFRSRDWLCDQVYRTLERHRAALCLADLPRCPISQPNDAPFVYLRRHGPGGRYRGCYSPEHLAADATRIRRWLADGRSVYVYYNNDIGGHAVDNARQLAQAVAR